MLLSREYLFEVGYRLDLVDGLHKYSVYIDPRSKLKVNNNKKKKVSKINVGDNIGTLVVKGIKKPLVKDMLFGYRKLKRIPLIELNQFNNYLESPKSFSNEELVKLLKTTSFLFAKTMFDGIELSTNDGQRIYLPFALSNIPTGVICYEERVVKSNVELEVF
jgi:hypothetical protein